MNNQLFNLSSHPKSLWFISAGQAFYSTSLATINSILILYLIYKIHFSSWSAYEIFAVISALIYILPLGGGYIGDKIGHVLSINAGYIIVLIGFALLSTYQIYTIFSGMTCFVIGNALITPNTNAILGLQYSKSSKLRNSAFTLYFLIYNIGFLISPIIAGYISLENYNLAFIFSACSILIAFFIFLYSFMKLKLVTSTTSTLYRPPFSLKSFYLLLGFLGCSTLITLFLLDKEKFINAIFCTIAIFLLYKIYTLYKEHGYKERLKIITFLSLCVLSIAFWSLYMLVPSFLTIFIAQNTNRIVFGIDVPPSCYYALEAFFIIVIGLYLSKLWRSRAEKNNDFSIFTKFAASLICIGIAFSALAVGTVYSNSITHLTNSMWIVFAYILVALGELLISPIALAMVGVFMPKGKESFGMGIWQAFIGFSAIISGALANYINIPDIENPAVTNPFYIDAFLKMGLCTLVIGLTILLLSPKMKTMLNI